MRTLVLSPAVILGIIVIWQLISGKLSFGTGIWPFLLGVAVAGSAIGVAAAAVNKGVGDVGGTVIETGVTQIDGSGGGPARAPAPKLPEVPAAPPASR